jgi:hypothetical protein
LLPCPKVCITLVSNPPEIIAEKREVGFLQETRLLKLSIFRNLPLDCDMQVTIAPYLLSTYKLLQRSFPDGIEVQDYLPLLALLDDEMSDRNLAEVVAHYTGKDYEIVSYFVSKQV